MNPNLGPFRIIWVAPKFPLGAPDGARYATRILLRHLVHLGTKVDLICVLPEEEQADCLTAQKALGVASCTLIRRKASPWPTLQIPYTFRTFAVPEIRKALHQELSRLLAADHRRSTFVLFDGLHPFASLVPLDLHDLPKKCRGVIYRAHNYETALWEQCVEQTKMPWMKWFYRHQAALVKTFERQVSQSVALIAPVSDEDGTKFRRLGFGISTCTVPIGMDIAGESARPSILLDSNELHLLFVGRLDWIPNKSGLSWFLEKVWPSLVVRRPGVRLKIAGVGNGRWLERYRHLRNLEFLGRVPQLDPLYEGCALTLAPLFQGSGTRVKILESARYARPTLSTALGAEGTGLKPGVSYFQAETAERWLQVLESVSLRECQDVGSNAFHEIEQRFDSRLIAKRFHESLQKLNVSSATPLNYRGGAQPQPEDMYAKIG